MTEYKIDLDGVKQAVEDLRDTLKVQTGSFNATLGGRKATPREALRGFSTRELKDEIKRRQRARKLLDRRK